MSVFISSQEENTSVLFRAQQLTSTKLLNNSQKNTSASRQTNILEQALKERENLPADASYAERSRIGQRAAQYISLEQETTINENAKEYLDDIKAYIKEKAEEAREESTSQSAENKEKTSGKENTESAENTGQSETQETAAAPTTGNTQKTEDSPKESKSDTTPKAAFTKQIDLMV